MKNNRVNFKNRLKRKQYHTVHVNLKRKLPNSYIKNNLRKLKHLIPANKVELSPVNIKFPSIKQKPQEKS